jgi:hypothetical protein
MRYFIFLTDHLILARVIEFRRLIWAGHRARMKDVSSAFKILTEKPTGKIPL